MSGGVDPTVDGICPSNEEDEGRQAAKLSLSADSLRKAHSLSSEPGDSVRRRFLSLRQLNALAAMIVLSASGMVSAEDAVFAFFSLLYLYFLSSAAFPPNTSSPEPPVFGDRKLLLTAYVSLGALLGLVLPIAYILSGVVEGDKEGIKAAAPHVFLLACQIFMEKVTFSRGFSLPMRAFVPILYNTKRMVTLADWVRAEVGRAEEHGSGWRLFVGRGLAMANLAFWAFNLFGFLLPVYLPRALKKYYGNFKKRRRTGSGDCLDRLASSKMEYKYQGGD